MLNRNVVECQETPRVLFPSWHSLPQPVSYARPFPFHSMTDSVAEEELELDALFEKIIEEESYYGGMVWAY